MKSQLPVGVFLASTDYGVELNNVGLYCSFLETAEPMPRCHDIGLADSAQFGSDLPGSWKPICAERWCRG